VKAFLDAVPDERRRRDAAVVNRMLQRITGHRPAMWGPSIVGFGTHDWVTADGRSTPWPVAGFSPRKAALVVYLMTAFPGRNALLAKLGKHTIGKSCLYIKRLEDVDLKTLEALVQGSVDAVKARK
jgi:hypothetical protein